MNQALSSNGATASASSTYDAGRLPVAAINGDRKGIHWGTDPSTGSGWHCATNNTYPDWLQVDFAGSKTITEINVVTIQDNYANPVEPTEAMTFTTYGITAFEVQYWNGSAWVTVPGGSVTGNNKVWRQFNFAPVTTSKIRVLVNNALAGYSRIVEVEAWSDPTATGLRGYWKFDENTGTTAADASGSGNGGTLSSGAGWGEGQNGAAVNLDGVNDYVQVGAQASLVMTSAASFSAWIYPTGAGSEPTYGGVIINKEGEYEIVRFPNGTIQWAFANSNPGWNFINIGYVAPLNQWTHLAVTYDNGTIKTYANGNLVHSYQGAGAIGDAITGQNDFRIGGRQAASQHFQGRIDEVRVYNRALSAGEVSVLQTVAANIKWLVADQLGTPRMVFDKTGSLAGTRRHDYLAFGEEWFAGMGGRTTGEGYVADGVRQKFTSYERDNETGLDYAQARYYASAQGRFTSPDPFMGSAKRGVPQSWNRYTYCLNSPLVLVDPSGLDWGYYDLGNGKASIVWFEGEVGKYKGRQYKPIDFGKSSSMVVNLVGGSRVQIFQDGRSNPLGPNTSTPPQQQQSRDDSLPAANQALIRQVAAQPFEQATATFAIASLMGASVAGSSVLLLDSAAAAGLVIHDLQQQDAAVAEAANLILQVENQGSRFGPNQQALVELAKEAKRGGVTPEQARTLIQWANEYGVKPARGPEAHPGRQFGSRPHIHVGPVNHIPVKPR